MERSPGCGCDSFPQRRFQVWMQSPSFGQPRVMGGTLEPESREGKRVALCGNRAAPSTGQLGETSCFCVCPHHEGCHRCAGECPGQLLPVQVRHGRKRMKVPVPADTSPLCQRCSKPFLEAVPTVASCNKMYFWTVRRGRPGLGLPVFRN